MSLVPERNPDSRNAEAVAVPDAVARDKRIERVDRYLAPLLTGLAVTFLAAGLSVGFVIPNITGAPPQTAITLPAQLGPQENRCYTLTGSAEEHSDWPLYIAHKVGEDSHLLRPVEDNFDGTWSIKAYFGDAIQDESSYDWTAHVFYLHKPRADLIRLMEPASSTDESYAFQTLPTDRSGDVVYTYTRLQNTTPDEC
jgi:hypothetical protein